MITIDTTMLLDPSEAVLPFVLFCIISLFARLIYNRYGYGITSVPGPFWAPCTDFWRLLVVWGRRPELKHIQLHEKYGPLVRLGPNVVSVSDPEAIRVIYSHTSVYKKASTTSSMWRRITDLFAAVQLLPSTTTNHQGWLPTPSHVQHDR
jgi:hypothetical protein